MPKLKLYGLILLVVFGFGINSGKVYASTWIPISWDGTHFATSTDTIGKSFCISDDPYNGAWGVYGSPEVNPTATYDLSTWTPDVYTIHALATGHGSDGIHFLLTTCDGADPTFIGKYLYDTSIADVVVNNAGASGDTTTRIIDILVPPLYSTTTSPVSTTFSFYNASTSGANGYSLTFKKQTTFETVTYFGWLNGETGYSTISTTTPLTLPNGTYTISVALVAFNTNFPSSDYSLVSYSKSSVFGLGENDNVTTINWGSSVGGYSSTSCNISFSGSFSLSDCLGYVFIPDSNVFSNYSSLVPSLLGKYPFQYIASIKNTWGGLTASSTANSPTYTYSFHDLGIGSSTSLGNFLPNVTVFSASSTCSYFGNNGCNSALFVALKSLASIALILGLFADLFFTTRNLIKT